MSYAKNIHMCDKNETGCKRNNQSDKNHKIFIFPDRNSVQKQHQTSAGDSRNILRISDVFISATICGSDRDRSTFVVVSRRDCRCYSASARRPTILKTTKNNAIGTVAITTHPCQRYNAVVTATQKKCIKPSCGNVKLFKMIHVLSDFVMLQY